MLLLDYCEVHDFLVTLALSFFWGSSRYEKVLWMRLPYFFLVADSLLFFSFFFFFGDSERLGGVVSCVFSIC